MQKEENTGTKKSDIFLLYCVMKGCYSCLAYFSVLFVLIEEITYFLYQDKSHSCDKITLQKHVHCKNTQY